MSVTGLSRSHAGKSLRALEGRADQIHGAPLYQGLGDRQTRAPALKELTF